MFCTKCGHQLGEDHKFCPQCGVPTGKGAPDPALGSAPAKRLVRPMRQKSIGGVCAGFANYLDVDLTLMRIIWLCTAVFTGVGFIAYIICWIVMPADHSVPEMRPAGAPAGGQTAPPEAPEPPAESSPV